MALACHGRRQESGRGQPNKSPASPAVPWRTPGRYRHGPQAMHFSPLLSLFDHVFYGTMDLLFLALNLYVAWLVGRRPWRRHLGWAIPYLAEAVFDFLYRAAISAHYFLHVVFAPTVAVALFWSGYVSLALGLYGDFALWRTFRGLIAEDKGIQSERQ